MNYNQAFMATHTLQAVLLILTAAVMNATYTLPMKLNRNWAWEHSWLAFTILGVVAVPSALAVATVPGLFSIYGTIPASTLLAMAGFGAGWGVSLVFFGRAIQLAGVAITFTVCLGTSAAAGALVPLVAQHPDQIATSRGALILTGIVAIFAGVALCGFAGSLRDRGKPAATKSESRPIQGFFLAFAAGILGSLLNLGLAFGGEIQKAAQEHGASALMMSNAVWLPCLWAGFIPGVIYCVFLMRKNGNGAALMGNSHWYYWLMGALMGTLWYGSIILYSLSTLQMGELGAAIGWPLFLSSIVVASSVVGVLTGEWKGAGSRAQGFMTTGVLCLVASIVVLSQATR